MQPKDLNLFQYPKTPPNENKDKDMLETSRKDFIIEFKKSSICSLVRNEITHLTLLQAEFENLCDITQGFIQKNLKEDYFAFLRSEYNEIAVSYYNQSISWSKVVIGNLGTSEEETENRQDNTGKVSEEGSRLDPTAESKHQQIAIELPNIEYSHSGFKERARNFLQKCIEPRVNLEMTDESKDTILSIIYLIRCSGTNCQQNLYIGLTKVGKNTRYKQHIEDCNSAVYEHLGNNQGHECKIEDMEILEECTDTYKLKILESLYIKEYCLHKKYLMNKKLEQNIILYNYSEPEKLEAKKYRNKQTRSSNDEKKKG